MKTSKILENIQNQVGNGNLFKGNLFEEGKCSADLTDVSENDRVVVDLDKLFPGGRMGKKQCECVLFYFDVATNFTIVPIELKGGRSNDVKKAIKQLKGGAAFAAAYIPSGFKTICHPRLFHKRPLHTSQYRLLRMPQSKVWFDGKSYHIKTARCGDRLADVLP